MIISLIIIAITEFVLIRQKTDIDAESIKLVRLSNYRNSYIQ